MESNVNYNSNKFSSISKFLSKLPASTILELSKLTPNEFKALVEKADSPKNFLSALKQAMQKGA